MLPAEIGTGWRQDDFDNRDTNFKEAWYDKNVSGGDILPETFDLRKGFDFEIYDQGSVGSCTANAICAALRYGRSKLLGHADAGFDPSRLFIYYNERLMSKTTLESQQDLILTDSGAQIRDGIKSLARFGTCSEDEWKYVPTPADPHTDRWPNLDAGPCRAHPGCDMDRFFDDAHKAQWKQYLGTSFSYYRIHDDDFQFKLQQIKRAISNGFPVVFGFNVYFKDQLLSSALGDAGVMVKPPMPDSKGNLIRPEGGHAIIAVGYTKDCLIIRNSWGPIWGWQQWGRVDPTMQGHFYMPFDWITQPNHCRDYWVLEVTDVQK